ncbi:MAG: ribulose-phosphate 3-epimerase [Candidatus Marinimicrobia bacterium]|nr:ribulose-phosphate 3-epimerase [Candidatus Neomarinimicrobiota bacterium]
MRKTVQIAPSILSADFSNLGQAIQHCEQGQAEYIHVDVMDGHFVPNLTIGPPVVKSLRSVTDLFIDVHMMVTNPEDLVEPFAKAGADGITFHIEASTTPMKVIDLIRSTGKQVGLSIKPKTPISTLEPFIGDVDLILVMSVEPGFGGQGYLPGSSERIKAIRQMLVEQCRDESVLIQVDGGVKLDNAREVLDAGADILVAGSAIFGTLDPVQTIKQFKAV